MKKLFLIPLVVLLLVGLVMVGCSSPASPTTTAPPVTTSAPTTTSAPPTTTKPPTSTTTAPSTTTTAPSTTTTAPSTTAPAPQTLTIGGLFGLTGFFSAFDQVQLLEAQTAIDKINADGGVKAGNQVYNLKLDYYDFKSTSDGVVAGANQLVFQDKVQYMIAPSAFFSPPTKDITEPNKVLRGLTFITGTPQELGPGMNYTFLAHNSAFEHCIWTATQLQISYPSVKTLAFAYPDDGTQDYVFGKEKQYLSNMGYTIKGDMITFANETSDFSPIATKILNLKPDAVFLGNGTPLHCGNLLKAIRQLGSNIPFVYSGDSAPTDIASIAGASASDKLITAGVYDNPPNTPALQKYYVDTIYKQKGEISIHMQAVNVLYMFKAGIEKAGSIDTTAVKNALESMDTIPFPMGTGKLGGLQTYGIKHAFSHPDEIWTLQGGKPVFGSWVDKSPMP